LLVDKLPRRLFEVVVEYEESDIKRVPGIGEMLHEHLLAYRHFRDETLAVEGDLFSRIGPIATTRLAAGWQIYLQYILMRFAGTSKEAVAGGPDFLNYGITWEDAERVFVQLSADAVVTSRITNLFIFYNRLSQWIVSIRDGDAQCPAAKK
jgi:hypothetical protein